mmetsp:Transcript_37096/g.38461  ORF Transcript_37096/g.38461 Transcript_37096/m.38461 type:complete len:214 (-) Transcript_37096:1733-2374(-)
MTPFDSSLILVTVSIRKTVAISLLIIIMTGVFFSSFALSIASCTSEGILSLLYWGEDKAEALPMNTSISVELFTVTLASTPLSSLFTPSKLFSPSMLVLFNPNTEFMLLSVSPLFIIRLLSLSLLLVLIFTPLAFSGLFLILKLYSASPIGCFWLFSTTSNISITGYSFLTKAMSILFITSVKVPVLSKAILFVVQISGSTVRFFIKIPNFIA